MVDLQNDMLMWLMSEAKGVERSVEGLARRLLIANLLAVHSTSLASDEIPSILIIQFYKGSGGAVRMGPRAIEL